MSVVLTSPLAIMMLLHYHAIATPFMEIENVERLPPSQTKILDYFLNKGIVIPTHRKHGCYSTTEKGAEIVESLRRAYVLAIAD